MFAMFRLAGSGRLESLDGLRAIAVLLVVVAHSGLGHFVPGGTGVTIFFVLSGFVITRIALREYVSLGTFNVFHFYLKRGLKILPPLAAIVLIPTLIYAQFSYVEWEHVLAQFAFSFNWVYMSGAAHVLPGSGVVWSLSIEEQFYIAFAVLWLVLIKFKSPTKSMMAVAFSIAIFSAASRFVLALDPENQHRIYYGTDTRIEAIALGVAGALLISTIEIRLQHVQKSTFVIDLTLALSAALMVASLTFREPWFRDTLRYSIQAWVALVWVALLASSLDSRLLNAFRKILSVRGLVAIGLASYSIYLVHLILIDMSYPMASSWPIWIQVVFFSSISLTAGLFAYMLIEFPLLALKRRLFGR